MTRKPKGEKPEKPWADFPLTPHNSGQWCKRIHGKLHYFGTWDAPNEAVEEYERRLPELMGQKESNAPTLRELCNQFLDTKHLLVDDGQLAKRTWDDYKSIASRLISHFGPSRPIDTLMGRDFESLFRSLPSSWGTTSKNNFVIRAKAIFNYAFTEELVDVPIRTGSVFKRSSQKRVRIERAEAPKKFFTATEINALVSAANREMAAMILLGVNCGFGNADCARLRLDMVSDGWISEPRRKTGVLRMAKLWPETIEALENVKPRPSTKHPELVFVTKHGNPYWTDGGHDAIATAFHRLTERVGVRRKNVGFYALRHVTQTIGDELADHLAVRIIMGHIDTSISEKYREHFDKSRIEKVCEHIRNWYLQSGKKQK